MSDKVVVASAIEAALFLAGLVLLWRLVLRPAARARAKAPRPLPHWSIPGYLYGFTILRVLAIALAVQFLTAGAMGQLAPEFAQSERSRLLIAGFSFQIGLLLGLAVSGYLLKGNRFQAQLDTLRAPAENLPPPLAKTWIPAAGLATFLVILALITPVMFFWPALLESLGHPPQAQDVVELFTKAGSSFEVGLILFFAVIVAPITEELLFRMGIFRYVRGRIPRLVAYALPALMFAAAHKSITAGLALFIFGLVQQAAYERTGRIAVPMIAHALFNLHTAVFVLTASDPYNAASDILSR